MTLSIHPLHNHPILPHLRQLVRRHPGHVRQHLVRVLGVLPEHLDRQNSSAYSGRSGLMPELEKPALAIDIMVDLIEETLETLEGLKERVNV